MIIKKCGIDYDSGDDALTLKPEYIGKHNNGWIITGNVCEDYYIWVNEFAAYHPYYGFVWGDFESVVYADTEEGFNEFYKAFEPVAWDYNDI